MRVVKTLEYPVDVCITVVLALLTKGTLLALLHHVSADLMCRAPFAACMVPHTWPLLTIRPVDPDATRFVAHALTAQLPANPASMPLSYKYESI
ncbi:MAG: hypothetical protein IPN53_16880 [Comamonadaceae bacterium]|nr:hypothetical protein [Comamonadaceae bacterium]